MCTTITFWTNTNREIFSSIDTNDKNLEGLIDDLSNQIKVRNPDKIRLRNAIKQLQHQHQQPKSITDNTNSSVLKPKLQPQNLNNNNNNKVISQTDSECKDANGNDANGTLVVMIF